MLPTPMLVDGVVRVLFASCDYEMRGRIFAAEFAPKPPFDLLNVSAEPVLDVGAPGAFDCDGVNPSQLLRVDGEVVLLYIGWRRGSVETPYTLFAGMARSRDGGRTFTKDDAPLLPPLPGERFFRTAPFITPRHGGYEMLYIGGESFFDGPLGKRLPKYSLRKLHSTHADSWSGPGDIVLEPDVAAGEIGFGRPVITGKNQDRLMVSIRTCEGYELVEGPAPGIPGSRPPLNPVFQPPFESWEAQMRCFGAPCVMGDYELLFYNGDGFGRSGVGLAWRHRD